MKRSAMGHTKVKKLARKLSLPGYAAVGLLECLWHLTAREAPRGDIGKLTNEDICVGIDWEGDESALIDALVECRWIDACAVHRLIIHDWHDHADDATKKAVARNRWTFAALSGNVATSQESSRLPEPEPEPEPEPLPPSPTDCPPEGTPKRFVKPSAEEAGAYFSEKGHPPSEGSAFCDFYESKGWKVGNTAMKDWRSAVRNWIRHHEPRGSPPPAPPTLPNVRDLPKVT